MKEQKTKLIKVDEDVHVKAKTDASSVGLSLKDYIRKLVYKE